MNDHPSICFIAPYAYGELTGTDNGHAGGIERQQALMARRLHERGFTTSVITWDEGQQDGVEINGVRLFKLCKESDGLPLVRFVHPRWTSLWSALRRTDADLYYYNLGDLGLGQVVAWCRRNGRKCVYSVANEPDCDRRLPTLKPMRERVLYKYGLRRVDRIVVQTHRQKELLREGFDRDATVIRMPGDESENSDGHRPEPPTGDNVRVLWVGRFSHQKRLEWLVDLAELCPNWTFDVVGAANAPDESARAIEQRGRSIKNINFRGRLSKEELRGPYRSAHLLCNTSRYEGFPNTFLEAWCLGLPVVTTFDPDGLVKERGLGRVADNPAGLAAAIREITQEPAAYRELSETCRRYFEDNHTFDVVLPQFERIFRNVTNGQAQA